MIDPHAHLRDWNQSHKDTVYHALKVFYLIGGDGLMEMPNTDPPLTSKETIEDRIELEDNAVARLKQEYENFKMFVGLYAGITADPIQIEEVVEAHAELFPSVVGLKMFAGHSTGNMGIIERPVKK